MRVRVAAGEGGGRSRVAADNTWRLRATDRWRVGGDRRECICSSTVNVGLQKVQGLSRGMRSESNGRPEGHHLPCRQCQCMTSFAVQTVPVHDIICRADSASA